MSELKLYQGDCRAILLLLEAAIVRMCVTSPPYYMLRDYGTGVWVGGNEDCEHKLLILTAGFDHIRPSKICEYCGAVQIDNQIGQEATPDEYAEQLVILFREVRRALAKDGTLWLNIGDSYSGGGGIDQKRITTSGKHMPPQGRATGYKQKDLMLIPALVAMALRADGWYLRSDIIWHKLNAMPESVTDRPTKSYEHIFLLSKSANYYYDAQAIAEPARRPNERGILGGQKGAALEVMPGDPNYRGGHEQFGREIVNGETRNARDVWSIATKPYPGAHYAVFPEALVERCILAGSARGDTVLDPFFGSGTTGRVAIKNGRSAIGIELNQEYHNQIEKRTDQIQQTLF